MWSWEVQGHPAVWNVDVGTIRGEVKPMSYVHKLVD